MTTRHGPKPLFFVLAVALVCSGGAVWAAQPEPEGLAFFSSREVVRAVPCSSGGWDVLGRFSGLSPKTSA
ncbi:MAG: hypothetical protein HC897_16755 [Thermoanaerobaculia bacterium]|nr:hypothetical protein [Thermoanaerobaculia bacterium]